MNPNLTKLETIIGYEFKDKALLATSLVHRSSLNEPDVKESNERLEFLGDAVLELLITDYLFHQKPEEPEGFLTSARSAVVKTESLSSIANNLNLGEYLRMSKGEAASGGRKNPSILEDALEALIGAIYKDGGLENSHKFIASFIFPFTDKVLSLKELKDPKSLLQEKVQAQGQTSPIYQVESESGPDHDKTFQVNVTIGNKVLGQGTGKNKQEAEQQAARQALDLL